MENFQHNKGFGQNFITDTNLLRAVVSDSGITSSDNVIEIGAGMGALTAELVKAAKKVIAYEIDLRLKETLDNKFGNIGNLNIIYKDILKENAEELLKEVDGGYKLVANLPYYITTPVLFYFIESGTAPLSITVMVQKEVAERIAAKPSTKDYGTLSVSLQAMYDVKITRQVNRKLFYPVPNVDSAVVHLERNGKNANSPVMRKLIKTAFAMRRKTLINNLIQHFDIKKEELLKIFTKLGFSENIRGEALNVEDFRKLSECLSVIV